MVVKVVLRCRRILFAVGQKWCGATWHVLERAFPVFHIFGHLKGGGANRAAAVVRSRLSIVGGGAKIGENV